jgi:hypothetical protein
MSEHIANIGARGARQRMTVGIVWIVIALVAFVWLMRGNASHWWRLLLFVPLAGAGIGVFQSTDKTCVALAAAGKREQDASSTGDDTLTPTECAIVRKQASRVWLKSIAIAVVLTAIAIFV